MKAETKKMQKIYNLVEDSRNKLGLDLYSPVFFDNLTSLIQNLTIVKYPLSKTFSGMILKNASDGAIIVINSNQSYFDYRFTIAHELYHFFDKKLISLANSIDESIEKKDSFEEKEANIFARMFLVPRAGLIRYFNDNQKSIISFYSILKTSEYFGVHPQIILTRMKECELISEENVVEFKRDDNEYKGLSEAYGVDSSKFDKPINQCEISVSGKYIELANKLLNNGSIGESKYQELMADAFRG